MNWFTNSSDELDGGYCRRWEIRILGKGNKIYKVFGVKKSVGYLGSVNSLIWLEGRVCVGLVVVGGGGGWW